NAIARSVSASQTLAALPRGATGPSNISSASRYANAATSITGKRAQRAQESHASARVASNQPVISRCKASPATDANSAAWISVGQQARTDWRWISNIAEPEINRKLAK